MKYISPEENKKNIEYIKQEVSILDYAQRLGYTIKKVGRYHTLAEHDSVRIDADKNTFYRNSKNLYGNSIIDFLIEFDDSVNNFHEAMTKLSNDIAFPNQYVSKPILKKAELKKEFQLPARDDNVKNVYAYLIRTRHIDKDIVSYFMGKGHIKQDIRKNCMFVGYKDKACKVPAFACLRGTNTEKTFKGDVPGSDYEVGFYINNSSSKLVVCESPIDIFSFMTIIKQLGSDINDYNYLALSSVSKDRTLYAHLRKEDINSVQLCLDNDEAGREATRRIVQNLSNYRCDVNILRTNDKDINEALCRQGGKIDMADSFVKQVKNLVTSCHQYEYTI